MSQSGNSSPETDTQEARLKSLTSVEQLNTCSLILSAAGISHRIQFISPQQIEIYVTVTNLQLAADELKDYEKENRHWPPRPSYDNYAPLFRATAPIVAGLLIYIYSLSGDWSMHSIWFSTGSGDSDLILSLHQYYRLVTALTLHADAVHLLGNCLLGSFLLHFLLLSTGNGIGLFSVLTSATLANFINVVVHGPGHHFVGFSTAVFVVIGMLCTIGFANKNKHSIFPLLMPVMAGLALLALLGSSGERTDLGAHLFGLLCGLGTGNIVKLQKFSKWRDSFYLQITLVLLSTLILWGSWLSAFSL
ncbi:MAG: rhomboid protease GluP [Desulforhopalus sp.]|jgi:rhomboid protease GluP